MLHKPTVLSLRNVNPNSTLGELSFWVTLLALWRLCVAGTGGLGRLCCKQRPVPPPPLSVTPEAPLGQGCSVLLRVGCRHPGRVPLVEVATGLLCCELSSLPGEVQSGDVVAELTFVSANTEKLGVQIHQVSNSGYEYSRKTQISLICPTSCFVLLAE